MKTRARAWTIRAAVIAVVTAASIVGVTTPAHAAPIIVNFILSTNTISAGQTVTATWTVRSDDEDGEVVNVSVQANNQSLQCTSGDCNVVGAEISQDGRDFEAVFSTTGVITSPQNVQIRVRAGNVESPPQPLTIQPTPQVPEVRGTVSDVNTGQPVKDARVSMTDSAGTTWDNVGTDENGAFHIPSTPQKPIAPGELRFTVRKEGINDYTSGAIIATANQPLTNVALKVIVNNPSASATTSLPPITATGLVTETPTAPTSIAAPSDSGLSGFSIALIVLGGLLVVVGIAAIVFLFVRRNNDEDGDGPPRGAPGPPGMGGGRGGPPGPPGAPGRGGPPGQRRPGPPDRTMPMRPGYGPPRPGAPGSRDQTVIARSPLADAPTQLHGRPPAGAPQPPYSGPPAYPGQQPPAGGWGPAGPGPQPPGYGGPPAGPPAGYPQQPAGYGGGQPGYGPPRPGPGGYDDPRHAGRQPSEGRRVDWMDD